MPDHDVVILVEEKSTAIVIESMAATLGMGHRIRILRHDGLGDLKNSISRKIRGEIKESTRFIILCDADGQDCNQRKADLLALVPRERRPNTTIRIACRELEAWYLAQPSAVQRSGALKKQISKSIVRRDPDQIANAKEVFLEFTHHRKQLEMARKIGPYLDPTHSKSRSFTHFIASLRNAVEESP